MTRLLQSGHFRALLSAAFAVIRGATLLGEILSALNGIGLAPIAAGAVPVAYQG